MDWKEFFKPNKRKLIIFMILFIIFYLFVLIQFKYCPICFGSCGTWGDSEEQLIPKDWCSNDVLRLIYLPIQFIGRLLLIPPMTILAIINPAGKTYSPEFLFWSFITGIIATYIYSLFVDLLIKKK